MKQRTVPKRLPLDAAAALSAICSTGKGRCWYCDAKLPPEAEAIGAGWDVQRFDDQPIASIILVCPACLREESAFESVPLPVISPARRPRLRRAIP